MLLIGAIILTVTYYAILVTMDIKNRKALRLAQASKNAIGQTNTIYPEPKEEPITTEVSGNSNTENFFGTQQSHDATEKKKEKSPGAEDREEGKNEPDKKPVQESKNIGEKESTPTVVPDAVLEMPAEKEAAESPKKEAKTSSPDEKNEDQSDEEKRRNLFAGTQMANDPSYEVAELDTEEAGALEMLAQEYMTKTNSNAENHAPTKEKLPVPVQDLDRMKTLYEEE